MTQGQRAVLTVATGILVMFAVGWTVDEFHLIADHGYAGYALPGVAGVIIWAAIGFGLFDR